MDVALPFCCVCVLASAKFFFLPDHTFVVQPDQPEMLMFLSLFFKNPISSLFASTRFTAAACFSLQDVPANLRYLSSLMEMLYFVISLSYRPFRWLLNKAPAHLCNVGNCCHGLLDPG